MLDIQLLRNDLDAVAKRLAMRGFTFDTAHFQELEQERKTVQTRTQELQAKRNATSKQIGIAKSKGEDVSAIMAEVATLGDELKAAEEKLAYVQTRMQDLLAGVPNLPHDSVPEGKSETDNVEVRRVGTPKNYDFAVKDHVDLGEGLKLLDFETAVKITGARFSVMKGTMARLHRALAQFMLDVHTQEHGYTEVYVPYLVNADSMRGTGQFPKFEDDQFHVCADNLYLIPTAEVPVTNIMRDEIVALEELPVKFVSTARTPAA
jgi:seryl-tRNA synthetase